MTFQLPKLPYAQDALEPYLSAETLDFHFGKHHKTYVDKLNALVVGTQFEQSDLEDIISTAPQGPIFNNAAQIWNHTFYFDSLQPATENNVPEGAIAQAIEQSFGDFKKMQAEFVDQAIKNFGSGWTWLIQDTAQKKLSILNTSNAGTALTMSGSVPLVVVDVWEHAYYIDYRNERPRYLEAFWKLVNWQKINKRLQDA